MVGHGHGRHAEFLALGHQFRNPVGTVEQAIVRVAVQVHEWLVGHESLELAG